MRVSTLVTLGSLLGSLSLAGPAFAQDAAGAFGAPTFTPLGASAATGTSSGSSSANVTFTPANIPPSTVYEMDPCIASMPIPVTGHVGPDGAWHTSAAPPVVVGGGPGTRCESPRRSNAQAHATTSAAPPATTTAMPSTTPSRHVTVPADPWADSTAPAATANTSPTTAATNPDGYRPPVLPAADDTEANPYAPATRPTSAGATEYPTPVPPFPATPGNEADEENPYRQPGTASPLPPQSARGGGPDSPAPSAPSP